MLISEADRIYETIFDRKAPKPIKKYFEAISEKIEARFSVDEVIECIQKIHDLEALELAARYTKKIPVLTEKFKIMVYLAETLPENYSVFINERPKYFFAYVSLISSLFRSCYKIVKGFIIMVVNRL